MPKSYIVSKPPLDQSVEDWLFGRGQILSASCRRFRPRSVDVNAVLGGKLLKSVLGGDSFDGGIMDLVVHETYSGVMVNKDGAASVPLLGEFPFQLGKESHFGRYHLVD
jgi:hypothetical protein